MPDIPQHLRDIFSLVEDRNSQEQLHARKPPVLPGTGGATVRMHPSDPRATRRLPILEPLWLTVNRKVASIAPCVFCTYIPVDPDERHYEALETPSIGGRFDRRGGGI